MIWARAVAYLALAATVGGACGADKEARKAITGLTKPDVVVIMTDDQTLEQLRVMPETIRAIGEAGTTFDQAVVSYPVCCPSRASFFTGQFSHNHGVRDNVPPLGGYAEFDDSNTLPVWLTAAGYYTAFVGKYLNGYDEQAPARVPPGWSDWEALVDPGTYRSYDYTIFANGVRRHYGLRPADYQSDVLTELALTRIEEAPADKPMFLNLNYRSPHSEDGDSSLPGATQFAFPTPAPRHAEAFADEIAPAQFAPHETPSQLKRKPPVVRNAPLNVDLFGPLLANTKDRYRRELASLLAVDEGIAKVIEALAKRRSLQETLLVFTSDNGMFHLEHGLDTKYVGYDPALRVPLLIAGPGFPANTHYPHAVSNVDLASTVLAAAEASAPGPRDGRPLQELITQPVPDRVIAIEGRPLSYNEGLQPGWIGARSPNWKYVRWADGLEEFYNLKADPDELENLAAGGGAPEAQLAAWRDLANKLSTCKGSECEAREPAVGP